MNCDQSNKGKSFEETEIDSLTIEKNDSAILPEPFQSALENSEEIQGQTTQSPKQRSQLFYLISAGSATGQQFLFNFFSAFAVLVGVTPVLLGFITSIRNLMSSVFQGIIGKLSDKMGRRYLLLLGFFMAFSSFVVLMFVNNVTMLIIISVIQAFSLSIIIPVWNATLGDVTEIDDRASYMGKLSAMGTAISVTLMLGLAVVFYLASDVFDGWVILGWTVSVAEKTKYIVAFGVAALNFFLCLLGAFLLQETRIIKDKTKPQPKMFLALKDPTFRKYFIVNSIFGLIMATMWPIFPIAQIVILEMTFTQIAIINAIFAACASLAQYFGGKLSDRIGRKPLIIFSRVSMFTIPIVMIGAIFTNNWLLLIISNVIGGTAIGVVSVAHNAYLLDISPRDQMGAYSGLNQVGWGIATFIGSLSAGFIATAVENAAPVELVGDERTRYMILVMFTAIAILRFLVSLGFFFIKESFNKESRDALNERRKNGYHPEYSNEDSSSQMK